MPTRRVAADLDFMGFALMNAKAHPLTSDPAGLGAGDAGRFWYRSDLSQWRWWTGTVAVNPLDRAGHTGTALAATISNFAAAVQAIPWGSLANPTAAVNAGGQRITNIADASAGSDAAAYGQVLALLNNRSFKDPVRVATTANVATLAGGAPNVADGVTLAVNDRILVKDQTAGAGNFIYAVTTLGTGANGTWTRAADADTSAEVPPGAVVAVQEGTVNGDKLFMLATNGPIVLGTTALVLSPYGASTGEVGVAGAGLTKTGSTYDVGAGTGIAVAADSVAIDTAVVGRKIVGSIPASTGGIFSVSGAVVTINHGLNNLAADVRAVYGATGTAPGAPIDVDFVNSDANNSVVTLPAAPVANQYVVSILG